MFYMKLLMWSKFSILDRPARPGKATVTMTLGRSVTLSWTEPEDDGGCKIGTYIVEYYRVGDKE